MRQLTFDGREEALPAAQGPVHVSGQGNARPAPLFAQEPFSARVPGTIALAECSRCGTLRHPMADRGETCCGWETESHA